MSIAWCILHVMISKSTSSQKTNTQTSEARQRYPSHMPNLENLQSKHGKDTKKTSNNQTSKMSFPFLLSEVLTFTFAFRTSFPSFLVSTLHLPSCRCPALPRHCPIATIVGWIPRSNLHKRSLCGLSASRILIILYRTCNCVLSLRFFRKKQLIQLSFICWCLYVGTNHSISILFCKTHLPSLCLQVCVSKGFFSQTLASCNFRLHWNSVQNSDSDWNVEGVNWVKGGKTDQIISWGQKDWHLLKLIALVLSYAATCSFSFDCCWYLFAWSPENLSKQKARWKFRRSLHVWMCLMRVCLSQSI